MGREWLLLSVGMRSSEQQHRNSLEAVHLPERKTHRVQKSMKIKKPQGRIELSTFRLLSGCSTNWAIEAPDFLAFLSLLISPRNHLDFDFRRQLCCWIRYGPHSMSRRSLRSSWVWRCPLVCMTSIWRQIRRKCISWRYCVFRRRLRPLGTRAAWCTATDIRPRVEQLWAFVFNIKWREGDPSSRREESRARESDRNASKGK